MRTTTADGGAMDIFLVFLSPLGLPWRMTVAWTIFWSFGHYEDYHGRWRWHGQFFGLSVTIRSAAADDGGMDHFLLFLSPYIYII